MRPSKFFFTLAVIIALLWAFLAILPGTDAMMHTIGRGVAFVVKLVLMILIAVILLVGPWLLGILGKSVGVPLIDGLLDEDVTLSQAQRITLGIFTSFIAAALGIGLTMLLMTPMAGYNWLYGLFTWLGWSGVWEVPPVLMGLYWFVGYIWMWGATEHEQRRSRY